MTGASEGARLLVLRPGDDVAVVLDEVSAGELVAVSGSESSVAGSGGRVTTVTSVTALTDVPAGHKIALRDLPVGTEVHKYGQVIGRTSRDVSAGEHVHSDALAFGGDLAAEAHPGSVGGADSSDVSWTIDVPADLPRTFDGIRRADGRVATRNYIGIVTSVNCAASTAKLIERHFESRLDAFPQVDGVVALTHDSGCGLVLGSDGAQLFERTLAGTALHPNFAALVVIGLGCEMLLARDLFQTLSERATEVLVIQENGGVRGTVDAAIAEIERLLPSVNDVAREPVPVSELVLSVKCGGSDGYSGITANPALGHAADLVVAQGGRVVIGETPEIHGAEHLLTRRAVSRDVAQALYDRMEWWKEYTATHGGSLDNNPSPGNKAGGLTTILEKSLGAAAKAGTSPLAAVIGYAEPVVARGLTFMDTPGYDPVSVTGMIAGGANVVVFTTGRGSMFGSRPAPCIKVATNSAMYGRLAGDMDLNAGVIAEGEASIDEVGEQLYRLIVDVASGRRTASEELGIGGEEFVPWHLGAVV